jgi:YD repeat-containing protein
VTGPDGRLAEQVAFAWDAFGHLTSVADSVGRYRFSWDAATGRLLGSQTAYYRRDGTPTEPATITYGYLPDGRLAEIATSSQIGGALRFGCAYDAAGRLTSCGPALSGTRQIFGNAQYDYTPDSTAATDTAISRFALPRAPITFAYRFDGLLSWEEDAAGKRTCYAYDRALPIVEFQPIEASQGGVPGNTYAVTALWGWGVDGLVFERWEHSRASGGVPYSPNIEADSEHVLHLFDPLGFALYRLDERGLLFADGRLSGGGARKATWYRPDGIDFAKGFVASTDPASGWWGQWGYFTDAATGRQRLGGIGRWYDPALGRYLGRDPAYLLDATPAAVLSRGKMSPYAMDGGVLNRTMVDWMDPYIPFAARVSAGAIPGIESYAGYPGIRGAPTEAGGLLAWFRFLGGGLLLFME